jgi:hypothetical protein
MRRRQWRHLDTCQLKTLLVADLPRVQCAEHGVVSVHVPWSEPGSGFTALYEALVIDWHPDNRRLPDPVSSNGSYDTVIRSALYFGAQRGSRHCKGKSVNTKSFPMKWQPWQS